MFAPEAAHHAAARAAFEREGDALALAPQCLFELWVVGTRPSERGGLGWSVARAITVLGHVRASIPVLADPPDLVDRWLTLVGAHAVRGKRAHDTRLVAFMQAHRISRLLTFNATDFRGFDWIDVIVPS